jgi:hypothetical protein
MITVPFWFLLLWHLNYHFNYFFTPSEVFGF